MQSSVVPKPRKTVKILARAATDALDDDNGESGAENAATRLRQFLEATCGSTLWAWLNIFDVDNDQCIDKMEFSEGMRQLNYTGKITKLFAELDEDGSGELSMQEIDPKQARVWTEFRAFCVENFSSVDEMMETLGNTRNTTAESEGPTLQRTYTIAKIDKVTESQFTHALEKMGWSSDNAKLFFSALCPQGASVLCSENFSWLGVELRRRHKKAVAKIKSSRKNFKRQQTSFALKELFSEFKAYLRKKCGNLVRAWRTLFNCTDSLILARPAFLKACANIGYAKDAKALWKVLDRDNSGFASLDEMDPQSAEVLAKFKSFIDSKFDSVPEAFAAIDRDGMKKVSPQQFDDEMRLLGWDGSTKRLFSFLDKDSQKVLQEHDVKFLERWSPLPYLLAPPNESAKEDIRNLLLQRYSNVLKAWRQFMDRDGDNHVNWVEFVQICKHFGYRGDIAGAWRAFDSDLSGYITLQEFDSEVSQTLLEFRSWCHEEFGNCKAAFSVFDGEGSNSLSFQKFRGACKVYGFGGNIRRVFDCCDQSHSKSLSSKDIAFLDDWEVEAQGEDAEDRFSVINVERLTIAPGGAAATEAEDPGDAGKEMPSWRSKVDDPLRLLKVLQVKQNIQQRFDMKLPPMLRSTHDTDNADGNEGLQLPTSIPLSARTPRYSQARKDRERKQWKIKDPDQCRQFWLNYQIEQFARHEQQKLQAMSRELEAAANEAEQEAQTASPTPMEEPPSQILLLKPTLDELLRSPRHKPQSLKTSPKGHSNGQPKQQTGHGLTKLPLLPEFGFDQRAAALSALKMTPLTAR
eukprot:TRINITY_DN29156_c0_g1_i1.p1 TRINITY_DN29156_c0_g1~~TRINITY_DN29156_c0_g1_i1.p1  ORF type:complete len:803 (+),score=151.56 TRINITY_DN29156_c0_g1_i1:87-2495(+)